jgi:hypothetical protein
MVAPSVPMALLHMHKLCSNESSARWFQTILTQVEHCNKINLLISIHISVLPRVALVSVVLGSCWCSRIHCVRGHNFEQYPLLQMLCVVAITNGQSAISWISHSDHCISLCSSTHLMHYVHMQ